MNDISMPIVPSSDKLKKKTEGRPNNFNNSTYPWDSLEVNQSFIVDRRNVTKSGIVSLAHKTSNKKGKLFKVTEHKDAIVINDITYPQGVFEVGRLE